MIQWTIIEDDGYFTAQRAEELGKGHIAYESMLSRCYMPNKEVLKSIILSDNNYIITITHKENNDG